MDTIRRLYLYAVSLLSLWVLANGVQRLLATVLGSALEALSPRMVLAGAAGEPLSLAIALIVVAGPIWAGHWWMVARSQLALGATGLDNRRSTVRALFFAVLQLTMLMTIVYAGFQLFVPLLTNPFVARAARLDFDPGSGVATLIVAGTVWVYHQRLRAADLRRTRLHGSAAWLTRLYRYTATSLGAFMAAGGAAWLITTLVDSLTEPQPRANYWIEPIVSAGVVAVVGLVVWWVHWRDANGAARDSALIGEEERQSRLRAVYHGLVMLVAAAIGAHALYLATGSLVSWLLGSPIPPTELAMARALIGPLLFAAPFAVSGALHYRRQQAELLGLAGTEAEAARRLARSTAAYIVALVGLAFMAGGAFVVLDEFLHTLGRSGELLLGRDTSRVAGGVAALIVAGLSWLPAWAVILRRRASDPTLELRSIVSRLYVYLVVGAALAAFVPAAALIVYRLLDLLLVGGSGELVAQLATPFATIVVAGAVALYHGLLLHGERELLRSSEQAVESPAEPDAIVPGVPALEIGLVLRAPAGTDLDSVVAALRQSLPAGLALDPRPEAEPPAEASASSAQGSATGAAPA